MASLRRALLVATVAAVAIGARSAAIFSRGSIATAPPTSLEGKIQDLKHGYKLEFLRDLPEEITAMTAVSEQTGPLVGKVFVGTSPVGSVYCFNMMTHKTIITIGEGLGDSIRSGKCEVNSLAINDLDRDGVRELIATTSQIVPRGRPRVYVWSLENPPMLRGVTRPDIRSSRSHGIGFLDTPGTPSRSIYVTFCGDGEIVEYQLSRETNPSGFAAETLGWKKVGQLPIGGEWIQSDDLDQDGRTELCVATGHAPGKAAIYLYAGDQPGTDLRLEQIIDEAGRFCNVRFLIADMRGDGTRELFAWWGQQPGGGESEVIRYRLGPETVRERTVLAQGTVDLFWPNDNQMTVLDLDSDGHPEVWFANTAGGLWRYDESGSPPMARIAQVRGEFGPIAVAPPTPFQGPTLLVALGRSVLQLVKDPAPPRPSSRVPTPAD
jgi:hypothetical protein